MFHGSKENLFNAGQTPRSIYPSIFNRFPITKAVKSKVRNFSTFFARFGLPWARHWDYRGKCHMDRKRIQWLSNALQHVPIYLQPFLRYSEISVASDWFLTVFVSEWAFFATFCFSLVRPWDNRGKCYMDRKRIQCLSNASLHVPIYLQPFLRYSELLVENGDIFRPRLCLAAPQGVTPLEFREGLDVHKTRMNGLSCGEESMRICSVVFIARQHTAADARYWYSNSVCLSVCLSVCPWHAGIVWKRLNVSS